MKPPPTTTTRAGLGDAPRELVAVVDGAQVDHAVELRTGYRQRPHPRARGEHQTVVAQSAAGQPS